MLLGGALQWASPEEGECQQHVEEEEEEEEGAVVTAWSGCKISKRRKKVLRRR